MIRLIIYRKQDELWSYRVDGHWGPGGAPLIGLSEMPLREACRVLRALGVRPEVRVEVFMGDRLFCETSIENGCKVLGLPDPPKHLPKPRRARKRGLVAKSSGVPGDG